MKILTEILLAIKERRNASPELLKNIGGNDTGQLSLLWAALISEELITVGDTTLLLTPKGEKFLEDSND